jgi:hypothetical protein
VCRAELELLAELELFVDALTSKFWNCEKSIVDCLVDICSCGSRVVLAYVDSRIGSKKF